jgi:beta-barrel assembly-enhancing protease
MTTRAWSPHRLVSPPLLALLLTTAGCGGGESVNDGDLNLVPLRVEWQLGRSMARDVARQLPLVEGGEAARLVEDVGGRLVARTELAEWPWHFYVVHADELNAFTLPGGHVYVFTGLLDAVGSRDELAAVLGHEIAHGVARHGTEQLTKVYGINILASLVLGDQSTTCQRVWRPAR